MKKVFFLFLLYAFTSDIFAQQSGKLIFESGLIYNKAIVKEEQFGNGNSNLTFRYSWENKYYDAYGYYAKLGYEVTVWSENNWNISFPVGMTYMNQRMTYGRKGYSLGCFATQLIDERVNVNHQNVNAFFGPSLTYSESKSRFSAGTFINNCLTVRSVVNSVSLSGSTPENSSTSNNVLGFRVYMSSQLSYLYNVHKNIWVGPSCEVYYLNVISGIHSLKARIRNYEMENHYPQLYITGRNLLINPGLKVQIDLK